MTPKELKKHLPVFIKNKWNCMIHGIPGVGKSDIVASIAKDLGYELQIVHLVTSDAIDAKGLPYPHKDLATNQMLADFIPFGDLKQLIDAKKPTICFLDDFGQAPATVQASWMQILLARRINQFKVSDEVVFIAATNGHKDRAGVNGILEPVKSRFPIILELVPDVNEWCEHTINNPDVDPLIIAFARFTHSQGDPLFVFNPQNGMQNSCLPRTLTALGRISKEIPDLSMEIANGAVGETAAQKFITFRRCWKELPDLELIATNPNSAPIPEKPDILYCLVAALSTRVTISSFANIMEYIERLDTEYQVLFIKLSTARDEGLTKNHAFIKWATNNQSALF